MWVVTELVWLPRLACLFLLHDNGASSCYIAAVTAAGFGLESHSLTSSYCRQQSTSLISTASLQPLSQLVWCADGVCCRR
jgi:hypothetical protein